MPGKRTPSPAAVAVCLKAMRSRAFFNSLLTDPQKALARKDLGLSAAEVNRLVRRLSARRARTSPAEALEAWDDWHKTGTADLFIRFWPIFF